MRQCIEKRRHGIHEDLEVDPAPERPFQRSGFPVSIALHEHDLGALQLQIHEATFRPLIRNTESKDIAPELPALFKVEHIKLWDEASKAAGRQSIS